jgi:hypothetical protein
MLGIQVVEILILLGALFLPSVAPASQPGVWFTESSQSLLLCSNHHLGASWCIILYLIHVLRYIWYLLEIFIWFFFIANDSDHISCAYLLSVFYMSFAHFYLINWFSTVEFERFTNYCLFDM